MDGLITDAERTILSNLLDETFATFSKKRNITVWKEPVKNSILAEQSSSAGFGFGDAPLAEQYIYTPVSGVFEAVIRYVNPHRAGKGIVFNETNFIMPVDEVRVKVDSTCHSFIQSGKTEKISFDERDFYIISTPQDNVFLDTHYYTYLMKPKV